jgi:hypothetical protein
LGFCSASAGLRSPFLVALMGTCDKMIAEPICLDRYPIVLFRIACKLGNLVLRSFSEHLSKFGLYVASVERISIQALQKPWLRAARHCKLLVSLDLSLNWRCKNRTKIEGAIAL